MYPLKLTCWGKNPKLILNKKDFFFILKTMESPYVSINEIWNSEKSDVESTISSMITRGFVEVQHEDPHVALLCMSRDSDFISPEEKKILMNSSFIESLSTSKHDHDSKLTLALYESEPTINSESLMEMETRIMANMTDTNLLERTRGEDLLKICKLDDKSGNAFYDLEGNLLDPNAIFQYQGHCYDVNMVYQYIKEGGVIDLSEEYIDKFFNTRVDYSNMNLTDEDAAKITFHDQCDVISMYRNELKTLAGVAFSDQNMVLELNRNPITELKCKFSQSLKLLDISQTFIRELNGESLPTSLESLYVKKCTSLVSVRLLDCIGLKSLVLSDCTSLVEISEDDLPSSLISLDVSDCVNLRKINLKDSSISKLIITGCTSLEVFSSIDCLNLKRLDFTGISKCKVNSDTCVEFILNDTTFEVLTEDMVPGSVKVLSVKGNANLTKVIPKRCDQLVSLNVEDCPNIKQISKGNFSSKLKSLRVIKSLGAKIQMSPSSFFIN